MSRWCCASATARRGLLRRAAPFVTSSKSRRRELVARAHAGDGPGHEVPFQLLVTDVWSAVKEPTTLTVRTRSAWADLWCRATANGHPRSEAPAVDWSTDWVLFVATGTRPTSGYGVEIRRLVRRADTIHVYAVETSPPPPNARPRIGTLQALTHPIHAVTTPREPDGVSFEFHIQREIPEQ
ncbi:protease complex subunit PrcB family protein [Streptomyces sp. NPDC054794]